VWGKGQLGGKKTNVKSNGSRQGRGGRGLLGLVTFLNIELETQIGEGGGWGGVGHPWGAGRNEEKGGGGKVYWGRRVEKKGGGMAKNKSQEGEPARDPRGGSQQKNRPSSRAKNTSHQEDGPLKS